jgi:hypothetical protein
VKGGWRPSKVRLSLSLSLEDSAATHSANETPASGSPLLGANRHDADAPAS